LAGGLTSGEVRGSERPELLPARPGKGPALPAGDRPFAHPFYWASFILVGDPN
jgi:CHAT domain-containing protein